MKNIVFLLLVIIFCSKSYGQNQTTKKLLINGKVEMSLPATFNQPLRSVVNDSSNKILLNQDQRIMIRYQLATSSNQDAVELGDNDITQWTDKQLSAIRSSARNKYIDDGIFLQDGKNIGFIKYKTEQQNGPDTYNLLFFMSVEGRLFQAHFMSPNKSRKKWEPIADEIANSLRVIAAE